MKCLAIVVCAILLAQCQGRQEDDARLIAAYSTRTVIVITTITSENPYTCYNENGAANCQKRRYRRYKSIIDLNDSDDVSPLEGTVDDEPYLLGIAEDESREGRIALTVWSTTSSTFTITSTSINTSTTFSLSFYCTVAGAAYPPICG